MGASVGGKTAKLFVISCCPDICTGLGLANVPGKLAHCAEELRQALEGLEPDVGLVIVTSNLAEKYADVLKEYRDKNRLPLITVIPNL